MAKHFETISFRCNDLNLPTPHKESPALSCTETSPMVGFFFFFECSQHHIQGRIIQRFSCGYSLPGNCCNPKFCPVYEHNWGTKNSILERSKCIIITNPGGMVIHPPPSDRYHSFFTCTFSRIIRHYLMDGGRGIIYNS